MGEKLRKTSPMSKYDHIMQTIQLGLCIVSLLLLEKIIFIVTAQENIKLEWSSMFKIWIRERNANATKGGIGDAYIANIHTSHSTNTMDCNLQDVTLLGYKSISGEHSFQYQAKNLTRTQD